MDMLRCGHTGLMRTWDDGRPPIQVVWFRVPRKFGMYEGETPFRSGTWRMDSPYEGVGEEVSWDTNDRLSAGAFRVDDMPAGYVGNKICGSAHALRNGGRPGIDPPQITTERGVGPCCPELIIVPGGTMEGYEQPEPPALIGPIYQITSSPNNSINVNRPTVADGELLLTIVLQRTSTSTWVLPSGYTEVYRRRVGTALEYVIAWKIAGPAEPAFQTWQLDTGSSTFESYCYVLQNVQPLGVTVTDQIFQPTSGLTTAPSVVVLGESLHFAIFGTGLFIPPANRLPITGMINDLSPFITASLFSCHNTAGAPTAPARNLATDFAAIPRIGITLIAPGG